MLDVAKKDELLAKWCRRNGIDLGDKSPYVIGYWCRVSGVSLVDECDHRNIDEQDAKDGWDEADTEIAAEPAAEEE